jgi:hypothetical protein
MSRLILQSRDLLAAGPGKKAHVVKPDESSYSERLAKYVPSEVLAAAYIFASNLIGTYQTREHQMIAFFVLLGICLLAIPLYYWKLTPLGKSSRLHCVVSLIAFLVWAYAMGGPFVALGWHRAATSGLILVAFTLFSGVIKP